MTPMAQMSLLQLLYPSKASGAMYSGVPQIKSHLAVPFSSCTAERPKSSLKTSAKIICAVSQERAMLVGFRSEEQFEMALSREHDVVLNVHENTGKGFPGATLPVARITQGNFRQWMIPG